MSNWFVIEHSDKLDFDKQKMYETCFQRVYEDRCFKTIDNVIEGYVSERIFRDPIHPLLVRHETDTLYDKFVTCRKIAVIHNAYVWKCRSSSIASRTLENDVKQYIGCPEFRYEPNDNWDSCTNFKVFDGIFEQLEELNVSAGEFMFNPNYGIIYLNEGARGGTTFKRMLDEGIIKRDAIANIKMIERNLSELLNGGAM